MNAANTPRLIALNPIRSSSTPPVHDNRINVAWAARLRLISTKLERIKNK